ncbi:MAG: glycosyltransferase family 39 protein [Armatimonadetes bacterium]|nr:glycosyltransferase family 39 protein [Armatimonadota bacterium]
MNADAHTWPAAGAGTAAAAHAAPWPRRWLLLILAGCLITLAGAPVPHTDGDAPLYGRIAKNVLASGEWLTLQHRPGWLVDKPPLTIWLIALSLRLGGEGDAALRFWQLLMNLVLVWVTYRIARLGAQEEEALLAALVFVSMGMAFYHSLIPQQDVPLTLFLALALYDYLRYRRDGRALRAVTTGLWVALAVLTKGLVGLAAFALIAGADLVAAWRRPLGAQRWRWAAVGAGAATFLMVAAPWFIIGYLRQGMPFVDTFFLYGNLGIGRFFKPILVAQPIPLWQALLAYLPMLILSMLPWTGLLPGTVREAWRGVRDGPPSLRLCALWLVLFFLLLSLSTGDKVIRYLHPLYPPLAVLAARHLGAVINRPRGLRGAAVISLIVGIPGLIGVAWLFAGRFPQEQRIYLPLVVPFLAVFFVTVAAFAVAALAGRGRAAVAIMAAGTLLSYGVLEWTVTRHWERLWPWRTVASIVNTEYRPGDRVLIFAEENNFADYHIRAPVEFARDEATLFRLWQQGRTFLLLPPGALPHLRARLRPRVLLEMPVGWVLVTNR